MIKRLSRQELSWVLYDVGNSAFVLIVVTTVMPIFFKDVSARHLPPASSTAAWGMANAAASLVVAVLAPILGALADYQYLKKRFFGGFAAAGIAFTLLLVFAGAGSWGFALAVFVLARIGFAGANVFYDAFLTDVTDPDRMNRISAAGYGWGYIGSTIPFIAVIGVILWSASDGAPPGISTGASRIAFGIVSVWWLAFSLPMLRYVHQRHYLPAEPKPIRASLRRLARTFRQIRAHRSAFLFLAAYFFYIDGVDTIITMAAVYGRDIGLSVKMLIIVVLAIQIVAFPFALLYGRLADRFSARTMIYAGIGVYTIIVFLGFFLPALSPGMKIAAFWLLAMLVATSQGGIQALSRSYFGRLIPARQSAKFFGFYNIFGKFATIIGPFLMGFVSHAAGDSRYGILSILVLFIIGGLILRKVEEPG
ncbi:MAG: MFS transporter [Desulfobacterales bacterium]|nr:MFS transporter [Desulfobacterales bacterium]